jgi:hypothetical protein
MQTKGPSSSSSSRLAQTAAYLAAAAMVAGSLYGAATVIGRDASTEAPAVQVDYVPAVTADSPASDGQSAAFDGQSAAPAAMPQTARGAELERDDDEDEPEEERDDD